MDVIKKISEVFTTEVKALSDGVLEFIGSVETTKDRDGEVIKSNGWELENYKKNPIVLWAHDYQSPPIGKALNVSVSKGKLLFQVKFADSETYPFADTIYKLCKGGFINATSVGFIPKEWDTAKKEGDPSRTYLKQELLELSIVPVPSNPDALRNALNQNLITIKEFETLSKTVDFNQELTNDQLKSGIWQMMETLAGCVTKTMCDKGDADKYSTMSTHGESFNTSFNKWVKDCKKIGLYETLCNRSDDMMLSFEDYLTKGHKKSLISEAEIRDYTEIKPTQAEINDEIDFLIFMVNASGINEENKPKAIELIELIKRLSGCDKPVEDKPQEEKIDDTEFKKYLNKRLEVL